MITIYKYAIQAHCDMCGAEPDECLGCPFEFVKPSGDGQSNGGVENHKGQPASSPFAPETPEGKCEVCGKPKSDSKHIKYGNDLDNPMKHEFEKVLNGIFLPEGFTAPIAYICNMDRADERVSIVVKGGKLWKKTEDTNMGGDWIGNVSTEEIP
jgi:hypothetical protein